MHTLPVSPNSHTVEPVVNSHTRKRQQVLWKTGEEATVASLVLDLFHMLPPAAVMFLETQQPAAAAAQQQQQGAGATGTGAQTGPDGKPVAGGGSGGTGGGGGGAGEGGAAKPGLVILTIQLEEKLPALPLPVRGVGQAGGGWAEGREGGSACAWHQGDGGRGA